jgi:hypothetical protein
MMLSLSNTLLSPLSSGSGVPALPAGLTNRWTAPQTGSDGDLISTLVDSIAANNGTAAGSARATLKTGANGLNGRNVVRFDGVANGYSLGTTISPQNFTMAAVVKRIGAYNISFGGTDFYPALYRAATNIEFGNNRCFGGVGGYANVADTSTGWQIIVVSWAGANPDNPGYLNQTSLTFGSTTNYGNATGLSRIGKSGPVFCSGDIADMLFWQSALTSQKRSDIAANLNATWGGVY